MGSPLRFQAAVAVVAITGAVLLARDRPPVEVAFTFQDSEIAESSGLVATGETVITVNDSGGEPILYVVDARTGETVGHTTYRAEDVLDVEAVTAGPGDSVWVADIGDNGGDRDQVSVYELASVGAGDRTVPARRYDLVFSDGARDAEALLVDPESGRLHLVSKGVLGGRVYRAPARLRVDRPNVLRPVAPTGGLVTDGAYFPDGRHVMLRSYTGAAVYDTATWEQVADMRLPVQRQGEGLAMEPGGRRVLLSTEGSNSDVLSVKLPEKILSAVRTAEPDEDDEDADTGGVLAAEEGGWLRSADTWLVLGGAAVLAGVGWLALRAAAARLKGSRRRSRWTR